MEKKKNLADFGTLIGTCVPLPVFNQNIFVRSFLLYRKKRLWS